jgi:hypothetical protein
VLHDGPGVGLLGEDPLERAGDSGMDGASAAPKERLVGGLLDQGVLEVVGRVWMGSTPDPGDAPEDVLVSTYGSILALTRPLIVNNDSAALDAIPAQAVEAALR